MVRGASQILRARSHPVTEQLAAAVDVEELKLDVVLTAGRHRLSDYDVILSHRFPFAELDAFGGSRAVRHRCFVQGPEIAAVSQVVADDAADADRRTALLG